MSTENERLEKLKAFLFWIVVRQCYPHRRATLICWTEVNWPEANEDDIEFLWNEFPNYIELVER